MTWYNYRPLIAASLLAVLLPASVLAQTVGATDARLRSLEARIARLEAAQAAAPATGGANATPSAERTTPGAAYPGSIKTVRLSTGAMFVVGALGCARIPAVVCRIAVMSNGGGGSNNQFALVSSAQTLSTITGADGEQTPASGFKIANSRNDFSPYADITLAEGERATFEVLFPGARVPSGDATLTLKIGRVSYEASQSVILHIPAR